MAYKKRRTSQADLLKRNRLRIDTSIAWRKTEQYDDIWKRMADLYAGKHFTNLTREDQIAVNVAKSVIDVIYPTISVANPKTIVMARDSDQQDRAVIAEAVVNAWWEAYNVLPEFRLAAKDFLIAGHGWIKAGWRFDEREVPLDEKEVQEAFEKQRAEADAAAAENPEMAGDLPTDEDILEALQKTKRVVKEDRPWVEQVSVHDVYVNPEATKMSDVTWIAHRIIRPLEEVCEDEKYDATARKRVEADRGLNESFLGDGNRRKDFGDDVKRVTVWEFYDIKDNTFCVFAHGGDGFLVKPAPIPYKGGHPFIMLRNYDVPGQFYPMGDLEGIEPLQHELNKTRSQLMSAREQFRRKHLYLEDAFGADGREALTSQVDNQLVPVRGDRPLTDVIAPMPAPTIPPELFGYSQTIEDDITTVSGVSEYQRGSAPSVRRTATEAAIIQDSVNARAAEKLSIIERGIAEISKKLIELARQFATEEDTVRVVGRQGKTAYVSVEPDDFDADFDYVVEAGSTVPKGEDYRRNEAMALMNALGPLIGVAIDPHKAAAWLLEQFGVKHPERFLMPPAPMGPPGLPPGAAPPPGAQPPAGGPGPENNPMAQDPALAAAMGAMNPYASQPAPPPGPQDPSMAALQQLAGQVGLSL